MNSTDKHKKHGKTVKTNFGNFGRIEIAIMGTPCGEIKKLAHQLIQNLNGFRIAYIDADHKTEEEDVPGHISSGAHLVYTDKIKFNRIDFVGEFDKYACNKLFNEYDLVLVNGNHFEAEQQIVVVDEKKPLNKKLDKIKNPIAILKQNEETEIPDCLINHLGNGLETLPQFSIQETDKASTLIHKLLIKNTPKIHGLVLAGGKSSRMGKDKGLIEYHGKSQREYVFEMLENITEKTFMSCRPEQIDEFHGKYEVLPDSFSGLGPFGAILSAFREYPNDAWLVIASDLPLLQQKTISELIEGRNPSKIATAFYNETTKFPDPLLTIWEPKSYPELLHFLSLGYSCPRKVLINSNVEILTPHDSSVLLNANSPEEYKQVVQLLGAE